MNVVSWLVRILVGSRPVVRIEVADLLADISADEEVEFNRFDEDKQFVGNRVALKFKNNLGANFFTEGELTGEYVTVPAGTEVIGTYMQYVLDSEWQLFVEFTHPDSESGRVVIGKKDLERYCFHKDLEMVEL